MSRLVLVGVAAVIAVAAAFGAYFIAPTLSAAARDGLDHAAFLIGLVGIAILVLVNILARRK